MSILNDHVDGKASFRAVTYTTPASVHYYCKAGPYAKVFVDDRDGAVAWCARHRAVKKRVNFDSNRSISRPNTSLPDPSAALTRVVPRDTSKIYVDKHTPGKKKVRTF